MSPSIASPAPRKAPPSERIGWLMIGFAVLFIAGELVVIALHRVPRSPMMVGFLRGFGMLPVVVGAGGGRIVDAARKAKKAKLSLQL